MRIPEFGFKVSGIGIFSWDEISQKSVTSAQDDLNDGCSQEMIDFLAENAENEYMHQCVYDENEVMVPTTIAPTTTTPTRYWGVGELYCWVPCHGKGGACEACNGYCCVPSFLTKDNGDCPKDAVEFLIEHAPRPLNHKLGSRIIFSLVRFFFFPKLIFKPRVLSSRSKRSAFGIGIEDFAIWDSNFGFRNLGSKYKLSGSEFTGDDFQAQKRSL